MSKRDPNKFNLHTDCKGCKRLWDELCKQDAVLGRLRAKIEEYEKEKKKGSE